MTVGTTNFPGALDSHTSASPLGFGEVNNQAYTLSTAAHTNSVTTITVASTSAFPSKGYLVIKREIVSYTGKTSTTFTGVTRGVGGTTAAAFLVGTVVEHVVVAANHNDLAAALVAVESHLIVMPGDPIAINGNCDHWQRSDGSSVTSTTTYSKSTSYCADRIFVLPAGASVSQARSTTVPDAKSRYSLAITGASSVTTVDIGQRIEAAVVNTRCLQSLVFSCYVRNESGAAFTPTLRVGTPGSSDDFTTVTNRLAVSLQECADSAWTRVYYVFDPSAYTNVANGLEVCLRVPSGSLVIGDVVRVAQFDLRPGLAAAAYAPPDPVLELVRCMRYCEAFGGSGTVDSFGFGVWVSTTSTRIFMYYTVRKRTRPTISYSALSDFKIWYTASGGSDIAPSAMSIAQGGHTTVAIAADVGSAVGTAGSHAAMYSASTTAARLIANAEL